MTEQGHSDQRIERFILVALPTDSFPNAVHNRLQLMPVGITQKQWEDAAFISSELRKKPEPIERAEYEMPVFYVDRKIIRSAGETVWGWLKKIAAGVEYDGPRG